MCVALPTRRLSGRHHGSITLGCKIWNGVASDDPSIAFALGLGPGGNCERLAAAGAHTSDSKLSPHSVATALASRTIHCPNPPNTVWTDTVMAPAVQHRKRFQFHYDACLVVMMSMHKIATDSQVWMETITKANYTTTFQSRDEYISLCHALKGCLLWYREKHEPKTWDIYYLP